MSYFSISQIGRISCHYPLCGLLLFSTTSGSFGLIACNTISEGDTRRVTLDTLVNRSCTIIRAIRSLPWPGTASQHVAVVWITKRAWRGDLVLDDTSVAKISTFLD
jgi:hypothetical protein